MKKTTIVWEELFMDDLMFCIGVYFVLCLMVTYLFYLKGKSQLWKYFLLNVVTTPVACAIYSFFMEIDYHALQQRILKKGEHKLCLYCAELIPIAAEKCEHCERDVTPEGRFSRK